MGGWRRRPYAFSWCIPANWPSSTRRRMPALKRRKLKPSPTTSSGCTPAGLPVKRMPSRPWRSMSTTSRAVAVAAHTRRTRRARRGRPAKNDPPPLEAGYRLVVDIEALANPEEANGWMVLATTVPAEVCSDTDILQAYQDQNTTVEPGFRWIKNPAAIAPVWLEKPER